MQSALTAQPTSVHISAKHVVKCASQHSLDKLEHPMLGPLDNIFNPLLAVECVFVYETSPGIELIPVGRLGEALERLLDYYPHLTGRFRMRQEDGTPELTNLGSGVELVEAHCDKSLAFFRNVKPEKDAAPFVISNFPGEGSCLVAPFTAVSAVDCAVPLMDVQHTRFACGSVAIGLRVMHMVTDAGGFMQLARDLGEVYRTGELKVVPHIRSYLADLRMTEREKEEARRFKPSSLLFYREEEEEGIGQKSGDAKAPALETETPASESETPVSHPLVGRVLRFSSQELTAIKQHASSAGGGWVSTFEALAAHLWQAMLRARAKYTASLPGAGSVSSLFGDLLVAFSVREGLKLPPHYFPNGVVCLCTPIGPERILQSSCSELAAFLHEKIRSLSADEVNRTLRWVAAQPHRRVIKQPFCYGNGSFPSSQWSRLDLFVHFDADTQQKPIPPVLVAPPFTPMILADGLVFFLPTEDQYRGALSQKLNSNLPPAQDIYMTLMEPLWKLVDEDSEFRRFRPE